MRGSSAVVFLIPNLNIQDEQQIEDVECGAELPAFYSLPYALNVNIIRISKAFFSICRIKSLEIHPTIGKSRPVLEKSSAHL